jgi:hypothetical protein
VKRRARFVRDTPVFAARAGRVPRVGGVGLQHAQGRADHGVAVGAVPGGGLGAGAGEPGAKGGDEHQVQCPVQQDLLPRLLAGDLLEGRPADRAGADVRPDNGQWWQCRQQPAGCAAVHGVQAVQQECAVRLRRVPGVRARHPRADRFVPPHRHATAPGTDHPLRLGGRVVREHIRRAPGQHHDITGTRAAPGRRPEGRPQTAPRRSTASAGGGPSSKRTAQGPEREDWWKTAPLVRTPFSRSVSGSVLVSPEECMPVSVDERI